MQKQKTSETNNENARATRRTESFLMQSQETVIIIPKSAATETEIAPVAVTAFGNMDWVSRITFPVVFLVRTKIAFLFCLIKLPKRAINIFKKKKSNMHRIN